MSDGFLTADGDETTVAESILLAQSSSLAHSHSRSSSIATGIVRALVWPEEGMKRSEEEEEELKEREKGRRLVFIFPRCRESGFYFSFRSLFFSSNSLLFFFPLFVFSFGCACRRCLAGAPLPASSSSERPC